MISFMRGAMRLGFSCRGGRSGGPRDGAARVPGRRGVGAPARMSLIPSNPISASPSASQSADWSAGLFASLPAPPPRAAVSGDPPPGPAWPRGPGGAPPASRGPARSHTKPSTDGGTRDTLSANDDDDSAAAMLRASRESKSPPRAPGIACIGGWKKRQTQLAPSERGGSPNADCAQWRAAHPAAARDRRRRCAQPALYACPLRALRLLRAAVNPVCGMGSALLPGAADDAQPCSDELRLRRTPRRLNFRRCDHRVKREKNCPRCSAGPNSPAPPYR